MSFDYTLRYPEIVEMLKKGEQLQISYDVNGDFGYACFIDANKHNRYIRKNYMTKLWAEYKFHRVDDGDFHFAMVEMCLDPDCDAED